jgi:chromosome segregation ATPase
MSSLEIHLAEGVIEWNEKYNALERHLTGEEAYRLDIEAKLQNRQQRCNALKVTLAKRVAEDRSYTSTMDRCWKAREVEWQAGAATQKEECSSLEVTLALSSSHCDELAQANQKYAQVNKQDGAYIQGRKS